MGHAGVVVEPDEEKRGWATSHPMAAVKRITEDIGEPLAGFRISPCSRIGLPSARPRNLGT